jgi:C4-type Zn-finger protein
MKCPRCGKDTWKIENLTGETNYSADILLTCLHCGFKKWLFAYVNDWEWGDGISEGVEE